MPKSVVQARRWARSLAFAVPAFLARQLGWRVGDMMYVWVENGVLHIKPIDFETFRRMNGNGEADHQGARPG